MVVADDRLEARADPFHRSCERLRSVHHRRVLGIRLRAHAEAAADVMGMQADALGRGRAGAWNYKLHGRVRREQHSERHDGRL